MRIGFQNFLPFRTHSHEADRLCVDQEIGLRSLATVPCLGRLRECPCNIHPPNSPPRFRFLVIPELALSYRENMLSVLGTTRIVELPMAAFSTASTELGAFTGE